MTKEPQLANGIKWLKAEWATVIVQFVIILITMAAAYSKMQSEVYQIRCDLQKMSDLQKDYVLRETWDTRNKLLDNRLDRMESKIDRLLMDRTIRGR